MQKVLIFTASIGNGHITAAKGLEEQYENEGNTVIVEDFAEKCILGKILQKQYKSLSKYAPKIVEFAFHKTNTFPPSKKDTFIYNLGFSRYVQKALKKYKPDVIIITFPLITTSIRKYFHGEIIVQTTDYFTPHLSWIWGEINEVNVLDPESKQYFSEYIDPKKIKITSFPLPSHDLKKKQNNNKSKKIISLFFHSILLKNEEEILKKIIKKYPEHTIQILAGNNYSFFMSLDFLKNNPHVCIRKWVEDVENIYLCSSIVGGKCGGAFISEVMKHKLPIIVTGAFSGQEQGNFKYLQKYYKENIISL